MKRGVWWAITSTLLFLGVASLVYWDYQASMFEPMAEKAGPPVKVVVPQGTSVSEVIAMLQDAEFPISATYFRTYLWLNDTAGKLRAGSYFFHTGQSASEVADGLVKGPQVPYLVATVKPGQNIWQVAAAFEASGLCTEADFLKLASDWDYAQKLGIPIPQKRDRVKFALEGWLYPETYYVAPGQDLEAVLKKMVQLTLDEIKKAKKGRLREYTRTMEEFTLTDYEFLVMASLVERETSLSHEKNLVASVFYNRLRKAMKLETDPTLTYTDAKKGGVPTVEDRRNAKNFYNTYEYAGLPPGPICSPSKEAIHAAVGPSRTDFLFFVATGDGSGGHTFTTNYEEHKKAVQVYLKNLKAAKEAKEASQEKDEPAPEPNPAEVPKKQKGAGNAN